MPVNRSFGLARRGRTLLLFGSFGVLFDWWDAGSTVPSLAVVPEIVWEAFLGIYCAIWGFRRVAPILADREPDLSVS